MKDKVKCLVFLVEKQDGRCEFKGSVKERECARVSGASVVLLVKKQDGGE